MKNLDILFLNPPYTVNGDVLNNYALLWLASYLKKHGINTKIVYLSSDYEQIVKKLIKQYRPKFVAISCKWYTNNLYSSILIAELVKKTNNKIITIAGGNTATYFDKELLKKSQFDIIVRGDGELPLLNIVRDKEPINCTVKYGSKLKRYRQIYVKTNPDLHSYGLVPLIQIVDNPQNLLKDVNYIWINQGCVNSCFYCSGATHMQRKLFNRKDIFYRNIKHILSDIDIFSKYSDCLFFDFPFTKDKYYFSTLIDGIEDVKYNATFQCWYLPTESLINKLSLKFKLLELRIDVTTLSESLRSILYSEKYIKNCFNNTDLDKLLSYIDCKKNTIVRLDTIANLPFETDEYFKEHIECARFLLEKHRCLAEISYIPLSIEPGSLLHLEPQKFGMVSIRNSFEDFLNLAKNAFREGKKYPYTEHFFLDRNCIDNEFLIKAYGVYNKQRPPKDVYMRLKKYRVTLNY